MKSLRLIILQIALLGGLPFGAGVANAAGAITVAPQRIVLEGRKRADEVVLFNPGNKTVTYRIGFEELHIDERGGVKRVEAPVNGQRFASQMLRVSPRQVTIPPRGRQSVRLMVRKPQDLAPGEYRSHLLFMGLPDQHGENDAEVVASNGRAVNVKIQANFAVSIPVLVRHGEGESNNRIDAVSVVSPAQNQPAGVQLTLHRGGDFSSFGDLVLEHRDGRGKTREVGRLNRVSVYPPNQRRVITVPLGIDGQMLRGGELLVRYLDSRNEDALLASTSLTLP